MRDIRIGLKSYRNKVLGCWLGKTIGGTLGCPYEGQKRMHSLSFFDPVPDKPLPNDDLDFQLVWLRMLEDLNGTLPSLSDFARYWLKYLRAWPPDEYGFCLRNLERGLRPPIAGCFENRDIDCMGAPIRSELWACLAPANPQFAAVLACRDGILDHAGGEGMYGEMFWAAVESAAFVIDDPETLIRIGLAMIPLQSHVARAVRDVLWCHKNGISWPESRDRIASCFCAPNRATGYAHPCLAAPNHAFTVIGWLYGRDYGDQLCTAVNCGLDTDCTGGTLGALLGILAGADGIPARWKKPVGETIVLDPKTGDCGAPANVRELTARTCRIAKIMEGKHWYGVRFDRATHLPGNALTRLFRNQMAQDQLASLDINSAVESQGDVDIIFHYNGEPVLTPGVARQVAITVRKNGEIIRNPPIDLKVPSRWKVTPEGSGKFMLEASPAKGRGGVTVSTQIDHRRYSADFVILRPDEAQGYDIYWGVPICPQCRARAAACLCKKRS